MLSLYVDKLLKELKSVKVELDDFHKGKLFALQEVSIWRYSSPRSLEGTVRHLIEEVLDREDCNTNFAQGMLFIYQDCYLRLLVASGHLDAKLIKEDN
jgi:hypothetical protein